MLRKILIISFFMGLIGCATPYQQDTGCISRGGYRDMQLNKDTYQVSFRGNGCSSKQYVQRMLLKRCAQLTLQNHCRYFQITSSDTDVNRSISTTPTTIRCNSTNNFSGSSFGNSFDGYGYGNGFASINPGQTHEIDRYISSVTMKIFSDNKNFPDALDAQIILNNKG